MKTNLRTTLSALTASTVLATAVLAAPGSLDPSFGTGGKVTTAIGSESAAGYSVALQADGKIVVAGFVIVSGTADFAIVRYNSNGLPDSDFDGDGKVTTAFGSGNDYGFSVAVQTDGKIVVAGQARVSGTDDFALARYNGDGTLDTTFSLDGKATTDFNGGRDEGFSVAVQPDGKIVVAGASDFLSISGDFALARYNGDGSLDTTFSLDGKVTTDFSGSGDQGLSVAVQPDGKIVVAGESDMFGGDSDFALARYNADGSPDTTFSFDGKVFTSFGSANDVANSAAVQADGKIVVAGVSFSDSTGDFALARYNPDGSLDTTFNGTGKVTTDFGGIDHGLSVAVQADGKILVAGDTLQGNKDFALARYDANGSLDATFGTDGKVTTAIGSSSDEGNGMALQADGKIVVVGAASTGGPDFAVARYSVALPDTRLSATASALIGNNIYNLTGAGQTLNTPIPHGGGVKTDFIRIQNDGPVLDSFKVRGTPGNAKFTVKYLRGSTNVTAQVVAGTFNTGPLAPGATKLLKAVITAKTPLPAQKRSLFIKATSASDAAGRDTALIKARSN